MKFRELRAGGPLSLVAGFVACTGLLAFGVTEELPVGSLQGKALMAQSGKVLKSATIVLRPQGWTPDDAAKSRTTTTNESGQFRFRNLVAGFYTVEAFSKAHTLDATPVIVTEGKNSEVDLELKPTMTELTLNLSQHVFSPEESAEFQLRGFTAGQSFNIDLYRINFDSVVKKGSLRQLLEPIVYDYGQKVNPDTSPDFQKLNPSTWQIKNRDGEGVFDEQIKLDTLPEGLYWLKLQTKESSRSTWIAVSRIGLVTKISNSKTVAYVADIVTGKAIPNVQIFIPDKTALKRVGVTRVDGTLTFGRPSANDSSAVVARIGDSHAMCSFFSSDAGNTTAKVWTYTDRPVYRPGDEVHFKGIIRNLKGNNYAAPPPGTVGIELRDPDDNLLQSFSVTLGPNGTYNGLVKLDPDVVGSFSLVTKFGEQKDSHTISVMAYRKPEFKMTVTPEKAYFTKRETVRMKVKCEYYFGGPVPGAKIQAYVYRAPLWQSWGIGEDDSESEQYEGWAGDYQDEITAVTDPNGLAILEYKPKNSPEQDDWFGLDSDLTFEVNATETGDKYFDASGHVKVVQGDYSIRGEFDTYFTPPGSTVQLKLATTNQDGTPGASKRIDVSTGYMDWTGNTSVFKEISSQQAQTDSSGVATLSLTPPKDGTYTVRCRSVDSHGNEIREEFSLWVWNDSGSGSFGPAPALQIVVDKKQYEQGENAIAIIRSDKSGGQALVTVENDEIHWQRVIELKSDATRVSIPVTQMCAPTAYVSVSRIINKQFAIATRRISIDLGNRKLKIEIKADREILEPREEVTYSIKTSREDGTPVSADLSFAIVDEAIYAIRADSADPLSAFYPKRSHTVQTIYSFPELYLDGGDKDATNDTERSDFRDTAFWNPHVITGNDGLASVTVKLPDNLTSWRATAIGIGPETIVGKATTNVVVRKPLMVRLSGPSQMIEGDSLQVSAVVHNDTGKDDNISIRLASENIDIEESTTRTLSVANGAKSQVSWTIHANQIGNGMLSISAESTGKSRDSMRITFPIQAHGREVTSYQAGSFVNREVINVTRINDAVQGRVRLTITPSLASGIIAALDDLVDYPYGCTEQTMSRFMPAVVVAKTLQDLNLPRPAITARMPRVVRLSIAKLKTNQHSDGGWGWWENDDSSAHMTAVVLEGLARAKAAGIEIDHNFVDSGIKWGIQWLTSNPKPTEIHDSVYLAYAILLNSSSKEATDALSKLDLRSPSAETLALYVLADKQITESNVNAIVSQKAKSAIQELLNSAQRSGTIMRWSDEWNTSPTARALQAMIATNPNDPDIQKVVRYLMDKRRGSSWTSTEDSAQVLVALSQVLRQTQELKSTYRVQVQLNGENVDSLAITPSSATERAIQIDIPIAKLRESNELTLISTGQTPCYYSVETRQTPDEKSIGALINGSGISIQRDFYRLVVKKMEDGTSRLQRDEHPANQFRSGDSLRCVLTITLDKPASFVMIEVPTPSNMRVSENASPEQWSWWWSAMSVFDNRVVLFASQMSAGTQVLEYNVRAETPGLCSSLPANAFEMYAPDRRASTAESQIRVTP